MKFEGKQAGAYGGQNLYEVEVDQGDGTILAYTVTKSDLDWLNTYAKSKWDVKYIASAVREI
jgi:hypothetical protein